MKQTEKMWPRDANELLVRLKNWWSCNTWLLVSLALMITFARPAAAQTALSGTTCPGAGCTVYRVNGSGSAGLQVVGAMSGTLAFTRSVSCDANDYVNADAYPNGSTTAVHGATAAGYWTIDVRGAACLKVAFSDYTSGAPKVYVTTAQAKLDAAGSGGGSGAPTDATYLTQTANGGLSAEQALASLATGLMKVTTTTGVVSSVSTSAGLAGSLSDETGSGAAVFANTPTLTTPVLGVATATSINGTSIPSTSTLVKTSDKLSALASTTSAELAGVISDETGSGAAVFATSPALVTPNLGTPSAAILTNATGLPIGSGVSGLAVGVATFLGTPSSANLAAAVTNETGSGSLVFGTSPALTTPNLGTPSAAALTNATGLPITTGVSGLGSNVATFLATPSSANLAAALTDETGSGAAVFANTPTLTTPTIASFLNAAHTHANAAGGGQLAEAALNLTDVTTANASSSAHGFLPKTSGNAFDLFRGNGTFGTTLAFGTLSADNPLSLTQTWNNAGVTFRGLVVNITQTAANGASALVDFQRGGTSVFRCTTNDGGCRVAGDIVATSNASIGDTGFFQLPSRGYWHSPSNRDFAIGSNGSAGVEYTIKVGAAPTLTSGWGTGATISGTNSVGAVTIGTTPGATAVLTFSQAWTTNAPYCSAIDETAGTLIPVVTTTTTATFTATFTLLDKVKYHCVGWQ